MTQFMRPDGRQEQVWCDDVRDDLKSQYDAIRANHLRITAEVLTTGHVSLAIEHPDGDYDIELCHNGPGAKTPKLAMEAMIERFDAAKYNEWLKELEV